MDIIDQFKSEFSRLMEESRRKNEFEFVNVLLGYKGMGDLFSLTHFYESDNLFEEFPKLMSGNYDDKNTLRLGLFLYCHFFEMDELYRIIGNLVNIVNGGRFQAFLFDDIDADDLYPLEKITEIRKTAELCGFVQLMDCFDGVYSNQLRNAFFHSNYSVSEGNFVNTSRKHEIKIAGKTKYTLTIKDDLAPLLDGTITFAQHFFGEIRRAKHSYQQNKIIVGTLSAPEPIVILGDPDKGLIGWESFTGSAIKFTDVSGTPYLGAWNIRFQSPNRTTKKLTTRLTELVDKDAYVTNDPSLLQLEKDILAHNDNELITELAIPFYNWANNTVILAKKSANVHERRSLLTKAVERFDKALEHHPAFSAALFNRILTGKEIDELCGVALDYRELFNAVRALWEKDKTSVEMASMLADCSYQAAIKENDNAIAISLLEKSAYFYEVLVEREPGNCDALHRLGHSLWKEATYEADANKPALIAAAKDAFTKCLACSPAVTNHSKSYADFLDYSAGADPENSVAYLTEAVAVLAEAIRLQPDHMELYYKRGSKQLSLFQRLQEPDEIGQILTSAKNDLETAVGGSPGEKKYLNNYGVALLQLGKIQKDQAGEGYFRDAIAIMDSLITDDPTAVNSYLNKSNALIGLYDIFSEEHYLNDAAGLAKQANELALGSADFLFEDIASRTQ
jgi:hypothetical protein